VSRTTISFTDPNQAWLEAQLASKEFKSQSDVVNAALRQIRRRESEVERIRLALVEGEKSGFSDTDPKDLLAKFKIKINQNEEI